MTTSERRQIENEMIFRRANEQVSDGLDELDAMHAEDNNPELMRKDDIQLEFMCECSDEKCKERVTILLSVYQKIHEDRDCFVIRVGHQVEEIEEIVSTGQDYSVVRKNKTIAEPGPYLNETDTNNV